MLISSKPSRAWTTRTMAAAQALQDLRQGDQQVLAEDAQHLIGDPGGISEGTQDVEQGTHPQLTAGPMACFMAL